MTGPKSVQRIRFEIEQAFKPETPSLSLAYNTAVPPKREQHLSPKSVALSPTSSITESSTSTYPPYDHYADRNPVFGYVRSKINEIESTHSLQAYEQSSSKDYIMPSSPPIYAALPSRAQYPKPNERHKANMKELIQHIPRFRLRKADTIIDAGGIERPNPFWNEIYNRKSFFNL